MKFAVLDIETIPCQTLPPECIPAFDESSVAVGNLKDPFKIREKIDDARSKFSQDLEKRMSLDPDLCEICCAVAMNDETLSWTNRPDSEHHLLVEVWDWIARMTMEKIPLVTFNGMSFDLPVLIKRAIYNDVYVPPTLTKVLLHRQEYNEIHFDLMQVLGGRNLFSGKPEFKSLNFYLRRFGLGTKSKGLVASDPDAVDDGSMVYPAWKEGRMDDIVAYCKQDVLQTAELFKRVAPWVTRKGDK